MKHCKFLFEGGNAWSRDEPGGSEDIKYGGFKLTAYCRVLSTQVDQGDVSSV